MRKPVLLTALAICSLVGSAWADMLTLRDGTTRQGRFVSGNRNTIVFQDQNGRRENINVSQVQSLQFEGVNLANTAATTPQASNAASTSAQKTIPAGTDLVVRTNEAIDSTVASEGKMYTANVDRDIVDNSGSVIIPKGSQAELVVRNVSQGGRTGSPDLVLDVQSLDVNGTRYLVSTQDVTQSNREGLGKNKRTGEYVGGGAVIGTILGAIAGGGKGAAIGAIAGAAAGAGAQVLTRGKEVKVPAETVLTFRLDKPVELRAQ